MLSILLSALLLHPPAAPEPATRPDCNAARVVLADHLGPWLAPSPAAASLRPGTAMPVTPGSDVTLEIDRAGTYGLAVDTGAWIDVLRDGQALQSSAHERGPACTTIRKIVEFRLEPGRYTLRLGRTEARSVMTLLFRK